MSNEYKHQAYGVRPDGTIGIMTQEEYDDVIRRGTGPLGKRADVLDAALRRYMAAVGSLGEMCPGSRRTYFEEDVTRCDEAQRRWKELNDAGAQARLALGL